MGDEKNPGRNGTVRQVAESAAVWSAAWTALLTLILLAVGLAVVWVAQRNLEIKGDSLYVALLLVPVVAYLLITGKIGELKLPGGVTLKAMQTEFDAVRKNVADVGELEPERSTYLGKLRQVQTKAKKDEPPFCLIYADVVKLRTHTREAYLRQQQDRRTEKQLRDDVIKSLGIALTDAFYKWVPPEDYPGAKHDLFFLEDPDVAMILRGVPPGRAERIAEEGAQRFAAEHGCAARTIVHESLAGMSPRELDQKAAAKLQESPKSSGRPIA